MKLLLPVILILLFSLAHPEQVEFQDDGAYPQDHVEYPQMYSEDQEYLEDEEDDMVDFAEHLADFLPIETFTLDVQVGKEESLMIWEDKVEGEIRGMFHSESQNDDGEDNVNLKIFNHGKLVNQYQSQRLGVFHVPTLKGDRVTFLFFSQTPVAVYFSYEQKQIKAATVEQTPSNQTETEKLIHKFTRIQNVLMQQESQMIHLLELSRKHEKRVRKNIDGTALRLIVETLMIIGSGFLGLWVLKNQFNQGYEMLV